MSWGGVFYQARDSWHCVYYKKKEETKMSKFNVGDRVRVVNYADGSIDGKEGTVVDSAKHPHYINVDFNDGGIVYLFVEREVEVVIRQGVKHADVTGREISPGDVIVYFTRTGSSLYSQKARVEFIGTKKNTGPHIRVLREDAVEKDKFTRKAWLWSFDNSVKVG